jgi:hypothetical protein
MFAEQFYHSHFIRICSFSQVFLDVIRAVPSCDVYSRLPITDTDYLSGTKNEHISIRIAESSYP